MKKITLTLVGILLIACLATAQDMNKIEVQLSATGAAINSDAGEDNRDALYALPVILVSYNLNPHISAGLFYTLSFNSGVSIEVNDTSPVIESSDYQSYGIQIKAGTNRIRRFRIYFVAEAFAAQYRDVIKTTGAANTEFTISRSGNAYSAGFGINVKVSRVFSINMLEAKGTYYSGELNYLNDSASYGGSVGLGMIFSFFRTK